MLSMVEIGTEIAMYWVMAVTGLLVISFWMLLRLSYRLQLILKELRSLQQALGVGRPGSKARVASSHSIGKSASKTGVITSGSVSAEAQSRLHVGNLEYTVSEQQLYTIMQPYGEITELSLPVHRHTGKHRGFAFVTFKQVSSAQAALAALNGSELQGRSLQVAFARSKSENS
jgi:cold-inducible RNA-binding protein